MELTCAVDEHTDVTLVELVVSNPTRTRRRVRIENRLDGPVLAPRQHGTPESGWDEEGVTVTVEAGDHHAVGYACRAPADEPPASIAGSDPVTGTPSTDRRAADVLTALGDPRPPRDAIASSPERESIDQRTRAEPTETSDVPEESPRSEDQNDCEPTAKPVHPRFTGRDEEPVVPPAIDAWLARIADRIEGGEDVDAATLTAVAERASLLAERSES